MKSVYYSALARAEMILKGNALAPLRHCLGRWRLLRAVARRSVRGIRKALLPKNPEWVQVRGGLAQGIWLRLNLRDEAVYWFGIHEPIVLDSLKKLSAPGSVFYDVGAHLGFFSVSAAKFIGPQGMVMAFEAERDNWARIKENAIRNGFEDRIALVEAAAWSHSSSTGIPFKRGRWPRAHGGVWADGVIPVLAEGEVESVPAVSLDDYFRMGGRRPDALKIDVEGGECEVLKGAAELLCAARPALICEVHHEQAAEWIRDWLARKGYLLEWHVPEQLYPRLLVAQAADAG
ncbi:MAG TPA: FkbM family methyltransferase [Terriglobia bacterium]|nr:FkbM family methyltransferase [Terriglobia bacterium]